MQFILLLDASPGLSYSQPHHCSMSQTKCISFSQCTGMVLYSPYFTYFTIFSPITQAEIMIAFFISPSPPTFNQSPSPINTTSQIFVKIHSFLSMSRHTILVESLIISCPNNCNNFLTSFLFSSLMSLKYVHSTATKKKKMI